MADLIDILPDFDLSPWRHLTYSLEKKNVLTAELISLDPVEIARKCPLPLKEVRRFAAAVTEALKADLGHRSMPPSPYPQVQYDGSEPLRKRARRARSEKPLNEVRYVRTLDPRIDECLGGGFPTGSICEVVGESAVGKTQFVLTLLLAAQLPPPQGLGKPTLYLTTEDPINTKRLHQMLRSHPAFLDLPLEHQPTTDKILTINAHNLERQDHIITFQIPEAVRRYDVGLVVVDSIAANFRIEFQGASPKVLAGRAVALAELGKAMRKIAHEYDVAIVCTNQVADRFDDEKTRLDKVRLMSSQGQWSNQTMQKQTNRSATSTQQDANPAAGMQPPSREVRRQPLTATQIPPYSQRPPPSTSQARKDEVMSLDFQQRFFTGWGDNAHFSPFEQLKTPALGLTWANQIDARIVLKVSNTHDRRTATISNNGTESHLWSSTRRRRHLKVVFAPWTPPNMDDGVEYELEMQGPVSVEPVMKKRRMEYEEFDVDNDVEDEAKDVGEHTELLDPKYWEGIEDEDFP